METLIASYRKIHQALQMFPIYSTSAEGLDLDLKPGLGKEEQDHYLLVVRVTGLHRTLGLGTNLGKGLRPNMS